MKMGCEGGCGQGPPERMEVPSIETPIGPGRLNSECQSQGNANGSAIINSLLNEAVGEPTEIQIAVERVELNLPCIRVHRKVEGS